MKNPLRLGDELFDRDIAASDALADVELGELDIEADEISAFPRDDEDVASCADWIRHLQRMSGKSVTASTSITPQAWLAESP
jgi:hypothetical protein